MNRKLNALAAAAALTLAGTAYAQNDGRGVPGVNVDINPNVDMMNYDKDSDGKITKAEARSDAALAKQFDKLDTNKDGGLTQAEFAKFEAPKTDR